jgi:hypothetical protein
MVEISSAGQVEYVFQTDTSLNEVNDIVPNHHESPKGFVKADVVAELQAGLGMVTKLQLPPLPLRSILIFQL